jgi:diadenosine tetraphosphate (Ap4A) HIT family hydrolase
MTYPSADFDAEQYTLRSQTGPCFVCATIARDPDYIHHIIYEDSVAIAFLDRYPRVYGHTLVAPRAHFEQVTGDFTVDEYLALQGVVYRIAEAIRAEVQPERVYMLSLGSQQGNSHVHWHIVPLPAGVPYDQQQIAALRDVLAIPEGDMAELAVRLRDRLMQPRATG